MLDWIELKLAEREGRRRRSLSEVDYLLGEADLSRLGSLRFSVDGQYQVVIDKALPIIVNLGRLIQAAERIDRDEET